MITTIIIGVIHMDSFDKKIEEYKQELIRYARRHGTAYSEEEGEFRKVSANEGKTVSAQPKKGYNVAFVSNRPMPPEYIQDDGNIEETNNTTDFSSGSALIEENGKNTPLYPDREAFLADNTKTGKLRVQAYASQQVFPISNAKVTVEKDFENGTQKFAEKYTDIDGVVQNISLPTKSKALSQTSGKEIPYSSYRVTVSHPQFETLIFDRVPIFEQIESMQPAAMTPKNETSDPSRRISDSVPNSTRR